MCYVSPKLPEHIYIKCVLFQAKASISASSTQTTKIKVGSKYTKGSGVRHDTPRVSIIIFLIILDIRIR